MSMRKETILVIALVLLCASSMANAWEFKLEQPQSWDWGSYGGLKGPLNAVSPPDGLRTSIGVGYASRNIWKGFDFYPSNGGAFSTDADVDFWGTGFHFNFSWMRPTKSGNEPWEWLVFDPYYEEDECWDDYWYEMDYRIGWRYYYFPDGPLNHCCHHRDLDFQEFYGHFAWPRLWPYGIVPYYEAARIWPSEGGRYWDGCPKSYWRQYGGWFHTFGMYRDWDWDWDDDEPCLLGLPKLSFRTGFEMTYNDGAGPTVDSSKNNADHDWSHCTFMLSSNFKLADNISLSAGYNYQVSMDDSVNKDNESWFTVGSRISF